MTTDTNDTRNPDADTFNLPAPITPGYVEPATTMAAMVAKNAYILAPDMLATREKEKLADVGHEFVLYAIGEGYDDSGAYWTHLIDLGGRMATFRLQKHSARDHTATALRDQLAQGPIGGVSLVNLGEKLGNQFLVLWPAGDAPAH